jgi:hypothetical protein
MQRAGTRSLLWGQLEHYCINRSSSAQHELVRSRRHRRRDGQTKEDLPLMMFRLKFDHSTGKSLEERKNEAAANAHILAGKEQKGSTMTRYFIIISIDRPFHHPNTISATLTIRN